MDKKTTTKDFLEEDEGKKPFVMIISIFLILLMVIFMIPIGSLKWIPQPKDIPSLNEVMKNAPSEGVLKLEGLKDVDEMEIDVFLKHVGSNIGSSCGRVSDNCYAKAMYFFVRDEISYVKDPSIEYIEGPRGVLSSGSADCDGHAVLLHGLLKSVGVSSRIVVTSNHAFVQAYIEQEAFKKSKEWVSLDATCKNCEFGEVSSSYLEDVRGYFG